MTPVATVIKKAVSRNNQKSNFDYLGGDNYGKECNRIDRLGVGLGMAAFGAGESKR